MMEKFSAVKTVKKRCKNSENIFGVAQLHQKIVAARATIAATFRGCAMKCFQGSF
jgi:hypothetical protein